MKIRQKTKVSYYQRGRLKITHSLPNALLKADYNTKITIISYNQNKVLGTIKKTIK